MCKSDYNLKPCKVWSLQAVIPPAHWIWCSVWQMADPWHVSWRWSVQDEAVGRWAAWTPGVHTAAFRDSTLRFVFPIDRTASHFWRTKLLEMMFKSSVSTSQTTYHTAITNVNSPRGVSTRLWAGWSGVRNPEGKRYFPFFHFVRTAYRSQPVCNSVVPEFIPLA
jgi:hypothetical protein